MGSMSWSEDTRCLFCEGRLPLYRKITHGQFCSNEHRKSYWQEQERLAIERLTQTHNSLHANRSPVHSGPDSDPLPIRAVAPLSVPADALPALEVPGVFGLVAGEKIQAQGGTAPFLITTDPLEYE